MAQRVTIVEVAQLAGVAISSVSAALNDRPGVAEETRKRVKRAAAELGYVPSVRGRSLSAKKAFAIGLVVRRSPEVLEEDPFFGAFIGGVEQELSGRGYALILQMAFGQEDEDARYRELTAGRRVDGVILNDLRLRDSRVELVKELDLPAVGVNPGNLQIGIAAVHQPSVPGLRFLVETLIKMGHVRIAHVGGTPGFVHSVEREQTWSDTLTDAGLQPGPVFAGDFSYEGGRRAAEQLLQGDQEPPTAVVCVNDLSAAGFISRAEELGFNVPADVSVSGYDGIALGRYTRPTLTTVQASPRDLGSAATRLLLDAIDDPLTNAGRVIELPAAEPVLRESTAPIQR